MRRRRTVTLSKRGWQRSRKSLQSGSMSEPEFARAEASRVDKPWGYELRWAVTDRYAGKVLHINKGEALSLQYHERKDEFQYLIKGAVEMELGDDEGALTKHRLK